MSDEQEWPLPARQWRITITEQPRARRYTVDLSWRRFPCRADQWDGHQYSQRIDGVGRIRSQEDLEELLALAVGGAWYEDVRLRQQAPPPP